MPVLSISQTARSSSPEIPNRRDRRRGRRRARTILRHAFRSRRRPAHLLVIRLTGAWAWWQGVRRAVVRRPRPRAAHRPHGRASPAAPGRGSAAPPESPDDQSADEEDDGPPRPAPRTTRKRGRPRKRRSFRAFTSLKTWRKRLAQAEAVAAMPGAICATLVPAEAPDEASRRIARVPARVADCFAALARRLRRVETSPRENPRRRLILLPIHFL